MVATKLVLALIVACAATVSCRHHAASSELAESQAQPAEELESRDVDAERRRHRRKRWYSGYAYGQPGAYRDDAPAPPPAPPAPPFDPFAYIYRRLDELAALVRQPPPPAAAPPVPIFVPYPVYLPQGACTCAAATPATSAPPPDSNATEPTFPNRFNGDDDDYDDVPIRPISFDPVKPDRPLSRPVPGVEHGSSQAGAPSGGQQGREPPPAAPAAPAAQPPSRCDLAVLTCCHQRYTTNQCFENLGCPAALRSGDPCDASALANVVSIFRNFYARSA